MLALSMIHFASWRFYLPHYHESTHVIKFLSGIKRSSFPGLPSPLDIFDIKVEPTVDPTDPSNKPMTQNPIQFATHATQSLPSTHV